jgi:cell wall-associated NlpC family hydrolase
MLPGCQAPTAEAPGDATASSPLLTDAAAVRAALNSRRPAANAANASGADGSAPLPPARTGGRTLTRFIDADTDATRAPVEEPGPAKPARLHSHDRAAWQSAAMAMGQAAAAANSDGRQGL